MGSSRIILLDNGSLEPAATLGLRRLSRDVGRLLGREVLPVSVLHSHKVDPALLDGIPAVIFEQAVRQAKSDGIDELIVLPLFIGPSRAITEYVPKVFADSFPGAMKLTIRPTLFGEDGYDLLPILIDHLRFVGADLDKDTILLCDHGSPAKEVTACRDALAHALSDEFEIPPDRLIACSMERREGPEYAFNEPLLATAIQRCAGKAVILLLFILPGRHGGPGGDVETIAKEHARPGTAVRISPLLSDHPCLVGLIVTRSGLPLRKPPHNWQVWPLRFAFLCAVATTGMLTAKAVENGILDGLTGQIAVVAGVALIVFLVYIAFASRRGEKR